MPGWAFVDKGVRAPSSPAKAASFQTALVLIQIDMPTVLRIVGLRVVVYPNDHRPPHVHVIGGGNQAVFNLNGPYNPPTLRGSDGFTTAELNRIASALTAELPILIAAWERFHDNH